MASPAPVVPASQAPAGAAPVASPGAGAAPLSPNERILHAIEAVAPQQQAQPQRSLQQQAAAAVGGQQIDPLEALLADLPQDHPARGRYQGLKTVEGRARGLGAAEQRANEMQRAAEVAAVAAVRRGEDPYVLAQQLGVEPADLIAAAGWQPGQAQPGQAAQPQTGQPASPEAQAAPRNFVTRWSEFVDARSASHPQSWGKPFAEGMGRAETLRSMADEALAAAAIDQNPRALEAAQRQATMLRAQADEAQAEAMMAPFTRLASMVNAEMKALGERLQKYEAIEAQRQEQAAAEAAEHQAWAGVNQAMRAAREPEGFATFGPEGYGIYQIDENGNVVGPPTPEGEKVLRAAHALITERGWPKNMRSLTDALDLIASEYVLSSEDGAQAPAGGSAGGGDATLPGNGLAPGNGALRPSPTGQSSAPTGMY